MRLTLLAALPLILPAYAAGPNAPFRQNATTAPTIQVYSRETLVDVTVTDAQGHPVRNLTPSDFTILEDDQPQSIRSFHEFGATTTTAVVAPVSLPQLPPNTYTNVHPATGPLTVLLRDQVNGDRGGAAKAADFIKTLPPGAQVAVLGIGARFTVLAGPTSDRAALLKALTAPLDPYRAMAVGCTRQVLLDYATLGQLNQLSTYLSGIKGRKNLLWFSNGISEMIFNGCQLWSGPLQNTYDLLGDAQVTVYPLDPDPRGIQTPPYPVLSGPATSWGAQSANQNMAWLNGLAVNHLSMEAVAEATGGQAFYNTNDLPGAIATAASNGSSYYTLSYVPPSLAYDGRYHAIHIAVAKPGLHLVYRSGYSAEDPAQIAHPPDTFLGKDTSSPKSPQVPVDPLTAALDPIAPPATQLLFDVRATPTAEPPMPSDPPLIGSLNPKLRKQPLTRYDLLFAVPSDQINFNAATTGVYNGSLEFDVAAFDPEGNLVTARSQTLKLPLTNAEYREFVATPFQFFQQLDLPPGQFTLRVGVLDSVSSKIGTLDIPVTIPK